jgi:hypothetical protein
MFYDDVFFHDAMRGLGFHGKGATMACKLVLVYANRWIMFLLLAAALLGIAVMIQRRRDLRRAVPLWTIPLLAAYCALAGRFLFNQNEFYHVGPAVIIDPPMLRSLLVAAIPVAILYLVDLPNTKMWKETATVRLAVIPLAHLVMTVVYLFSPYVHE